MLNINIASVNFDMIFQIACAIMRQVGFQISPKSRVFQDAPDEMRYGLEVVSVEEKDGKPVGRIWYDMGLCLNEVVESRLRLIAKILSTN